MKTLNSEEYEMTNTIKKNKDESYQALYEELEIRYGAGLAQEIVDQIKKTDDTSHKPEYMAVKALSEVLEVFRADSQKIVKNLKNLQSKALPEKVVSLEEKRLRNQFKRVFQCYWLAQHSFYTLYERALKIHEVPETYRYDKYTKPTKMAA